MVVFPKRSPLKFKLFNFLNWIHKIVKLSKYKKKIKFDKNWKFQNGRSRSNRAAKIQTF